MRASLLPVLTLTLFLTACGTDPATTGADTASSTFSIDGYWTNACHPQSSGAGYASGHLAIYSGSMHADLFTSLSDSSCVTADLRTSMDSTFKIPGTVTMPANSYALDSVISSLKVTPLTAIAATSLNAQTYCGLTNWQVGVPQEIGYLPCGGSPAVGHTNYGIVSLSGSSLFFGLPSGSNDGSTPARRPTALNLADFYTM